MILSMTGYATTSAELDNGSLTLELRAVNHRYLDIQLRMPDELRGFRVCCAKRSPRNCSAARWSAASTMRCDPRKAAPH